LKTDNKAFKVEKYEHSYPHCWRTDKPVLYYPLDSWFVKATKAKERMQALNETINWKPESTGTGRFGEWLKNLNDWNLSRSRYWGIPIPIWRTEDGSEEKCIGSTEELINEINRSIEAGIMDKNPFADFTPGDMSEENYEKIDLHKNYVDEVILVSDSGKAMTREADLIDVWFDSGSMPYAQLHYPFENKELIDNNGFYPADFIAEGVDQTRGWFYTMHAIGTMVFDSVAYKNVISNGLVLDKNGKKMSKRLGNAVDPFETLKKYGPDATRWYMISNAQPWDNLKFDLEGIGEVQRKLFGTLYNTYNFFALYANIDGFDYSQDEVPVADRPEIDQWILSRLNSLIAKVDDAFDDYEPTRATRLIQDFVNEHLSNWYVRLCRRRFWKGTVSTDKLAAYQTLYTCLETVAKLSASVAPFFMDRLFKDLNKVSGKDTAASIHLSDFPEANQSLIDSALEERMEIAQKLTSMTLSLRKKEQIKVRQPLRKIMVPILDDAFESQLQKVESLILSEVNIKELDYLKDTEGVLVKKIKPNFKALGPKYGKLMKLIAGQVNQFDQNQIAELEKNGKMDLNINEEIVSIDLSDVEISSEDIPGWLVANEGQLTVAMDITIDTELAEEGMARELVNRIQNLRKDNNFEVTDKISLRILGEDRVIDAVTNNKSYICDETLTEDLQLVTGENLDGLEVELEENLTAVISIDKLN
ncbi:class I tRNA ligase family protein, partial [Flavobacteriales bacterium]|nr:class I tRNA ligase family protein [Flavobacteriales bacterium]